LSPRLEVGISRTQYACHFLRRLPAKESDPGVACYKREGLVSNTWIQRTNQHKAQIRIGVRNERLKTLQNDPAAKVVGDLGHFYETACSAWGADLGDDFRAGFTTEIPTVIVQGTWDTSTPFDNAIELLPSFDDLHFVIVEGGSHGALDEAMGYSKEFRAALMNFVATGEMSDLPDEILMPPIAWAPPY
jgi:pimeloyl-ACP methyl ester carboxylesterase